MFGNDFSRPPIPDPNKPRDFSNELNKLDPAKPIGVFVFNVDHSHHPVLNITTPGVNASRNNYRKEMQRHYGSNMLIIDNPTLDHLNQFSEQFNAKFANAETEVHFVANHHQNTYDDNKLAEFFASINATHKRALVLSCGPDSKAYENSGCDYVMIPAPDGQGLGVELSIAISPAYRRAISWLAESPDAETARKELTNRTGWYNNAHVIQHKLGAWARRVVDGSHIATYKSPIVVVPTERTR